MFLGRGVGVALSAATLGACLPAQAPSDPIAQAPDTDVEDAVDAQPWWEDLDQDGYGAGEPVRACAPPPGWAARDGDCDDTLGDVHPDAPEVCNGRDDDCDGGVDLGALDAVPWYADLDGDGYGSGAPESGCGGADLVAAPGDCDDAAGEVHPGAVEVCGNGQDDDCDAATDCRRVGRLGGPEAAADAFWDWTQTVTGTWGAWVGDVDGDGLDDAAIGGAADGAVILAWGATTFTSSSLATGAVLSAEDPEASWLRVDGGDVDGDGFSDVLAADGGRASVYWGGAVRATTGALADCAFTGASVDEVAFVGDLDGDGVGDWAASDVDTGTQAGTVYLIYGSAVRPSSASLEAIADATISGDTKDRLGTWGTVDGADVDGDGLSDLLVCAPDDVGSSRGGTWATALVYGSEARASGSLGDPDAAFVARGYPGVYTDCDVTPVGDVDGDGRAEVAFALGTEPAHVWVWSAGADRWSGSVDTTAATSTLSGSDGAEARVAAGDLDGDGFADLAIAQPYEVSSASEVAIFYGASDFSGRKDLTKDADARIGGVATYGVAVAVDLGGDANGDGFADLLAVAPVQQHNAWVLLGSGL